MKKRETDRQTRQTDRQKMTVWPSVVGVHVLLMGKAIKRPEKVQPLESGWIVYGPEYGYHFPYPRLLKVK